MPWANNPEINALRLKYNAALAAHRICARVLIDARMQGTDPPSHLFEAESKTRLELADVRARLLSYMTKVTSGSVDFEPPMSQT